MRRETIIKMETVLDHLSGEELGMALLALNDMQEVLDAIYLQGIGKKNRPCGLLQVLCHLECEETVLKAIILHTHTLGVRVEKIERVILHREAGETEVCGDIVAAKNYDIDGKPYSRPEADSIRKLAMRKRVGAPAFRFTRKNQG